MQELKTKLVIGISSRVLFDLKESHDVFEKYGVEEYRKYQVSNENNLLEQGDGFNLVTKLLNINKIHNTHNSSKSLNFISVDS